jgi:hypothetical protein
MWWNLPFFHVKRADRELTLKNISVSQCFSEAPEEGAYQRWVFSISKVKNEPFKDLKHLP